MTKEFVTESFKFEYLENDISDIILWESHCHAEFEMIAVIHGDISIMIEGKNYRLTENQIIIIPPLTYHTITANKQGIYRRITTLFGLCEIPSVIQKYFSKGNFEPMVIFSASTEKLKSLCENGNRDFSPLADALMIQIFYEFIRTNKNSSAIEVDEFLQKAVAYIDEHLNEKILLEDLANQMSRSKSSFCHLFQKKMKITPKQYILQKKLAYADMLISGGTSPTVAASEIGYENYCDFYRMYKKHFGKSPAKKM